MNNEHNNNLEQRVRWKSTGNPLIPYVATVHHQKWKIRINDFPDEPMYTLLIDGEPNTYFDDWPENWTRSVAKDLALIFVQLPKILFRMIKGKGEK